jgi:transcriptional regulator with XRE-family HTH domain
MTPEHCRSARAWLAWTQGDLAAKARVGLSTVKDFENGKRASIEATLAAMKAALEAAGIGFSFVIDENGVKEACGITFSRPEEGAKL